jgi:hypothetical protein
LLFEQAKLLALTRVVGGGEIPTLEGIFTDFRKISAVTLIPF